MRLELVRIGATRPRSPLIVEGFARRVSEGRVPAALRDIRVPAPDLGALQAGAGMRGEFEHRLQSLVEAITASVQRIVLFIDEAHMLIGAVGQAVLGDATNMLKPALAHGELRTIAATSWVQDADAGGGCMMAAADS